MCTLPRYLHGRPWAQLVLAALILAPLAESGATTQQLVCNPANPAFGKVLLGKSSAISVTMTNTGSGSVTVKSETITNAAFTLSGLNLPLTLAAGRSTTFNVNFAPKSAGTVNAQISFVNTSPGSPLVMNVSGQGIGSGTLTANPSSASFPQTPVGQSQSKFETITNSGTSSVTLSSGKIFGAGFSDSGLSFPLTLKGGASVTFTLTFAPTTVGDFTGSFVAYSGQSQAAISVNLSGSSTTAGQLTVTPNSVNFGNVTVGTSSSQTATLSASGASVTISSDSLSGSSEFNISGLTLPLTLAQGKSATFTLTFSPTSNGSVSGTVSFNSNAFNNPVTQSLAGTGVTSQHVVALTWDPSTSQVSGYNVYRGVKSGGPYTRINSGLDPNTNYSDNTVQSGKTYFYVTTAVDSSGNESSYSNQVQATVP